MSLPYEQIAAYRASQRANAQYIAFLVGGICGVISLLLGSYWLSSIGIGAFFYFFTRFLQESGRDLPIESFILVMSSIQWIIGPVLDYAGYSDHYKYFMYVPEEQYMLLAVPGVIALSLGLYAFHSRKRQRLITFYAGITRDIINRSQHLPFYLIGIGFIFSFLGDYFPPSLTFPAYILSNIKYIGLIYLLFSDSVKYKSAVVASAFFLTFLSSLRGAMFHDLLLWFAFIGMYAACILRPSTAKKL